MKPLTKNKSDLNNNFFAKYSYIYTLYPKQGGNRMFVRDFNISGENKNKRNLNFLKNEKNLTKSNWLSESFEGVKNQKSGAV